MKLRRVVTGFSGGKSKIVSDGNTPKNHDFAHIPGNSAALIWATGSSPALPSDGAETISQKSGYVPTAPGETRLMMVTFPPDSVMGSVDFSKAGPEFMEHVPDLAVKMEPDNPGMHTTDSVDYGIVLDGEVWLEVDDGKQVHLKQHDVIVQNGTRHAWRNKSDKPVKILFVLIGAQRKS